jgi:hypothetical protein
MQHARFKPHAWERKCNPVQTSGVMRSGKLELHRGYYCIDEVWNTNSEANVSMLGVKS